MNPLIRIISSKSKRHKYIALAIIQCSLIASVIYSLVLINSDDHKQRVIEENIIIEKQKTEILRERERINRRNAEAEIRRKAEEQRIKQIQIANEQKRIEVEKRRREAEAKRLLNEKVKSKVSSIKIGMSQDAVTAILGYPDSSLTVQLPGGLSHTYYYGPIEIRFDAGGVTVIREDKTNLY